MIGAPRSPCANRVLPQLVFDQALQPDPDFVGAFGCDEQHAALAHDVPAGERQAVMTDPARSSMLKVLAVPHCPEASPPVSGIRSLTSQARGSSS